MGVMIVLSWNSRGRAARELPPLPSTSFRACWTASGAVTFILVSFGRAGEF